MKKHCVSSVVPTVVHVPVDVVLPSKGSAAYNEQQLQKLSENIKCLKENEFFLFLKPDLQAKVLACVTQDNVCDILGVFEEIVDGLNCNVFCDLVKKAPRVFLRLLREPSFVPVVCHPDRSSVGTTNSARNFTSFLWEILKSLRSSHKNIFLIDTRNLPIKMIDKVKKKMMFLMKVCLSHLTLMSFFNCVHIYV